VLTPDGPNAPLRDTSVKVPPKGTRGMPFPRFLARLGNRMIVRRFQRKGGAKTQGGVDTLVLETVGAKSGAVRRAVLGYLEESPESWLVIASAVGAARHPAWLHNLARDPDVTVEFGGGRRVDVRAETLEGDDRRRAWERIAVDAPEYVKYGSKTDREIPVVRLRARSTG
jgi:deazaflavin-dependent oxidoreductase (nitroreductase family)